MKKSSILCITVLTAGVAFAGLFDPDYRGDENSAHVVFENPLAGTGIPAPLNVVQFETGPSIYPLAPVTPSGFHDGFYTVIQAPNFIDELPMMKARVQLVFNFPTSYEFIYGNLLTPAVWNIVGSSDPLAVDTHHYIDIEIFPTLDVAEVEFANFQDPNNSPAIIEIDTVSVPEPATLGLLGLISGGIYFSRRFFIS